MIGFIKIYVCYNCWFYVINLLQNIVSWGKAKEEYCLIKFAAYVGLGNVGNPLIIILCHLKTSKFY